MADRQERPVEGSEPEEAIPTGGDEVSTEMPIRPIDQERLVQSFERLFIRHEKVDSIRTLTADQISIALEHQEADRKRSHERSLQRDRQRHELTIARQIEDSKRRQEQADLKRSRLTFLPRIGLVFGIVALLGTALILLLLLSYGAKDQIPVVLAFLSGLIGGIFTGFGGGFASAKMLPAAPKDRALRR